MHCKNNQRLKFINLLNARAAVRANQLTGFYMIATLAFNELIIFARTSIVDVRQGPKYPSAHLPFDQSCLLISLFSKTCTSLKIFAFDLPTTKKTSSFIKSVVIEKVSWLSLSLKVNGWNASKMWKYYELKNVPVIFFE